MGFIEGNIMSLYTYSFLIARSCKGTYARTISVWLYDMAVIPSILGYQS